MKNNWLGGLIFIILAAITAVYAYDQSIFEGYFLAVIASVCLLCIIFQSIRRKSFFGVFVPISIIVILFKEQLHIDNANNFLIIAAAVLLAIGCSMIFRKKHFKNNYYNHKTYKKNFSNGKEYCKNDRGDDIECEIEDVVNDFTSNFSSTKMDGDDQIIRISNSFSEASKFIETNSLKEIYINNSFGELNVYFDKVFLDNDLATAYIDSSFGQTNLFIPRRIYVDDQLSALLGAVTNKVYVENSDQPMLVLKGNVQLGEIRIIRT